MHEMKNGCKVIVMRKHCNFAHVVPTIYKRNTCEQNAMNVHPV